MNNKQANKKKLTATQKKNRYRWGQWGAFSGEIISILTPFIVLGAVNFDEWFKSEQGWKVGLGGSLALALMGLAVWLFTKKKEGTNSITNGWITMIVGWFAITFIFMLLSDIITQISMIMFYGGLGLLGAFGLDIVSNKCKEKADAYKQALSEVKKETILDDARREVNESEPIE